MARYQHYNYQQTKMLPINFSEQILPGSFEFTVHYLVDHELDLSPFNERFSNDETGRPAYDPAILLKIILVAYSRGITSSRKIERLCRENIVFMALSADQQPHFTTIADFISRMREVIEPLFLKLLLICDDAGLIGGNMFAIDGCKLPSNASKEWSGTHSELSKKQRKLDRAVRRMMKKHREEDAEKEAVDTIKEKELNQIQTLQRACRKIKHHLQTTDEKIGHRGKPIQSNITDNDSAKMKTARGTIQGYNGVAAVDASYQIVIAAEAFGQGPENNLLEPLVDQVETNLGRDYLLSSKLTADSGFHNHGNLEVCDNKKMDAYIADGNFRKRDPKYKDYQRFKPKERQAKFFSSSDFTYNPNTHTCHCPNGKEMWSRGPVYEKYGNRYVAFSGYLKDCRTCPLLKRCMRKPIKEVGRQVTIPIGKATESPRNLLSEMRTKIDSEEGRHIYSLRLGTVEPVFANINTQKRLNRFGLRGKSKVNAQWLMYCMVHNIEKIQKYGSIV
jgi:transposase